ncbi:hypothetical protein [Corynebacterium pacaense]|uniref:hypothetical protein n=1 Tax=Corynebacterium pacaense TaxID=1816684 RepID=UPI0009BA347A|nr:hypothetical protein [Corynebacterium pacaense]
MTSTQLDTQSGTPQEEPLSLPGHPEVITESTVTVVVEDSTNPDSFPSLIGGAAATSRLLGATRLHIVAPAQHLPALAVAAGEMVAELPEGFLFCEAGCAEHDHSHNPSGGAMVLSAESVIQMGRAA